LSINIVYQYKFENINPLIVANADDVHALIKESHVVNQNNLVGKFSFFLLENIEILYKIQILKHFDEKKKKTL